MDQREIKNPFRVPDNYFEQVNRKILASTSQSEDKQVSFPGKYLPYMPVAAAIAGFIIIGFIALKLLDPADSPALSEIMGDEVELYLNDIDLNSLEKDAGFTEFFVAKPEVESEEIIDYLLNENIQISEIYEEL